MDVCFIRGQRSDPEAASWRILKYICVLHVKRRCQLFPPLGVCPLQGKDDMSVAQWKILRLVEILDRAAPQNPEPTASSFRNNPRGVRKRHSCYPFSSRYQNPLSSPVAGSFSTEWCRECGSESEKKLKICWLLDKCLGIAELTALVQTAVSSHANRQ